MVTGMATETFWMPHCTHAIQKSSMPNLSITASAYPATTEVDKRTNHTAIVVAQKHADSQKLNGTKV